MQKGNDKNGILLPTKDSKVWITTLNDLLKDEDRLVSMSNSAIQSTLDDYGWEKMVKEYEDVFLKVLSL